MPYKCSKVLTVHYHYDLRVSGKISFWLFVHKISCHQDRISERTKYLPSHTNQRILCLRKRWGDPAGFGCNLSEGRSGSPAAPLGLVPFKYPYIETEMAGPVSEPRRRLNDLQAQGRVLSKHILLKIFMMNFHGVTSEMLHFGYFCGINMRLRENSQACFEYISENTLPCRWFYINLMYFVL